MSGLAAPVALREVCPGSADEAALVEHRQRLEVMAREGLLEPGFDLGTELSRPFRSVYAAWLEDRPVGAFFGSRVADELHVLSVIVDPGTRRRGIGRALTELAMREAGNEGAAIALLEVRRGNLPAVRLYRSLGFVATRVRKNYYEHPMEDAVEMVAELTPGALAAFGEPLDLD